MLNPPSWYDSARAMILRKLAVSVRIEILRTLYLSIPCVLHGNDLILTKLFIDALSQAIIKAVLIISNLWHFVNSIIG